MRRDPGTERDLLAKLECLPRVVLGRQPELVARDGPVDDDPGRRALFEVLGEHELEPRAQPLRHGQASGRVDVARHEIEVLGADADRIESNELAGDPEHVARDRADREVLAVSGPAPGIRSLPGHEQRAHVPLAQRRIG